MVTGAQFFVGCVKDAVGRFRQSDVSSVIGGEVVPQLPYLPQ